MDVETGDPAKSPCNPLLPYRGNNHILMILFLGQFHLIVAHFIYSVKVTVIFDSAQALLMRPAGDLHFMEVLYMQLLLQHLRV